MGNIHKEVFPVKVSRRFLKDPMAVYTISRHQPVMPHLKKLFTKFFIMKTVCAGEEKLFG